MNPKENDNEIIELTDEELNEIFADDVDSWGRSACYPQGSFYPLSDGISTHIPPDH